jgi:acetolactate synthase I/II/III large subunit
MPNAGSAIASLLYSAGHRTIFGVPGESYLPLLDALGDFEDFTYVSCRHEGGASFMACAAARLSRSLPALLAVTRGPGLANAMIGLHTASQDGLPVIALVGLPERVTRQRRAFQEFEFRPWEGFFKDALLLDNSARITELLVRAHVTARSGRPGPVLLGLPEDMLYESVPMVDSLAQASIRERIDPLPRQPLAVATIDTLHHQLSVAKKPIIVVGGSVWSAHAAHSLGDFCMRHQIPVGTGFRCQDYVDNHLACYVGDIGIGINPQLESALASADLVVAVGTVLDDPTTDGFTRRFGAKLVQVVPDATQAQFAYPSDIIEACPVSYCQALATREMSRMNGSVCSELRASYEKIRDAVAHPTLDLASGVRFLNARLPRSSVMINGSGNYAGLVRKHFQFAEFGTQLAPRSGAMGYAVPAAIAAAMQPVASVVSLNGDGCFLMNANELASISHAKAPILFWIVDNAEFGTIATYQRKLFAGRRSIGTALVNPDFVAFAESFGVESLAISSTDELLSALGQWCESPTHLLLHIETS